MKIYHWNKLKLNSQVNIFLALVEKQHCVSHANRYAARATMKFYLIALGKIVKKLNGFETS